MSTKRTRFLLFVVAAVITVGGIVAWTVYERGLQGEYAAKALRTAKEISASYSSVVERHSDAIRPSLASASQKSAFQKLEDIAGESTAGSDDETIAVILRISRLQTATFSFLALLSEAQVRATPFDEFQKDVGDKSSIQALITEYNAAARGWNSHSSSLLGSIVHDAGGGNGEQLPYLRIDGMEDTMSIQL